MIQGFIRASENAMLYLRRRNSDAAVEVLQRRLAISHAPKAWPEWRVTRVSHVKASNWLNLRPDVLSAATVVLGFDTEITFESLYLSRGLTDRLEVHSHFPKPAAD